MGVYPDLNVVTSIQDTALSIPRYRYLHETVLLPIPRNHGKYVLKGLFYEYLGTGQGCYTAVNDDLGRRPMFTLKVFDYDIPQTSQFYNPNGLNRVKSLHQLYLEHEDPSEYNFAVSVFGNYEHWKALTKQAFFKKYLKEMRDVLEVKMDAKTIRAAKEIMESGVGPVALQAAKWLNQRIKENTTPKRGRPSSDEVEGELKRQARDKEDLGDDLERLGL